MNFERCIKITNNTRIYAFLANCLPRLTRGQTMLAISLLASCSAINAQPTSIHLVTEHLPPYQIVDSQNQVSGFATEVVRETLKRANIDFELSSYSWARSYNLVQQRTNYCIYSIARLPIREHLFHWIGQITEVNNAVIWGLKRDQLTIHDLEDIKQYITAVSRNDATHLGMLAHGFEEEKNLYVLENTEPLLNLLYSRESIKFIVADDITISYRAKLAGVAFSQLQRIYELTDLPLDFYLACNLNTDAQVITALTKALKNIHQDGTYRRILQQWQANLTKD
jgi:polar amino acid transport system substrate-binding protein